MGKIGGARGFDMTCGNVAAGNSRLVAGLKKRARLVADLPEWGGQPARSADFDE